MNSATTTSTGRSLPRSASRRSSLCVPGEAGDGPPFDPGPGRFYAPQGAEGVGAVFVPDEQQARLVADLGAATDPGLAAGVFPGWRAQDQALALPLRPAQGWAVFRGPVALGRPMAGRDGGALPGVRFITASELDELGLGAPGATAQVGGIPVVRGEVGATARETAQLSFAALFSAWWRAEPGAGEDPAPLLSGGAEETALAVVEGRLLAAALQAPAPEPAMDGLLLRLALVRRERWADLAEGDVAVEQRLEVARGLALFAGDRCAAGLHPRAAELPVSLLATLEDLGGLPPPALRAHAGWGLVVLLDRLAAVRRPEEVARGSRRPWASPAALSAGWQAALRGGSGLQAVLETYTRFDGGSRDDAALQSALQAHGYPAALERARQEAAETGQARQALVERILRGEGTLLAVEVSQLGPGRVTAPVPPQAVHARLAVYPEGATFAFGGGTALRFSHVPVSEDRRAGLLQVRVQGQMHLQGDGSPLNPGRPAAFSDGLELVLPGLRIRARAGTIEAIEGGYLLRLTR